MKGDTSHVFTLMVDNEFGVLTRITALIRRAGWNIRSLAVAETSIPEISRLTVCLECRHHSFETVLERLGKQSCVREISIYDPESQVARELAILRMGGGNEAAVTTLTEEYGAQVIERRRDGTVLCSVCCEAGELDRWMPELKRLGMTELARTGTVAMKREASRRVKMNTLTEPEGRHEEGD